MGAFIQRRLANGLQVCLEPLPHLPSAACGFLVRTGSRDEVAGEEGLSHFLEHMCFKGTRTRSAVEINQAFDRLGSQYNAYTSAERTIYYGWVPAEKLPAQAALLAEMMRSTMTAEDFATEKEVILEEIAQYRDSLMSSLYEKAMAQLFAGSPLAHSVLGYPETIAPLPRERMLAYHARRYGAENLVFVAAGQFDPEPLIAHVEALTADWGRGEGGRNQPRPTPRPGRLVEETTRFTQQGMTLSVPGPAGRGGDLRPGMLSRILSGDNSRIYWEIQQRGLCPSAGIYYQPFSDAGLFVLYGLGDPERMPAVLDALREQARRMTVDGPTDDELQRVKNNVRTSLATDGDSPMSRLLQLVEDLETLGTPKTLEEHLGRVEAITVESIRELLAEYPLTAEGFLATMGPPAAGAETPPA